MKIKKVFLICVLGLFPLWIKGEEVKKQEITISYIEGDVEVLLYGKKDWEKAKLYGKLKEGDRIRTKLQSKAELKLPNGSTINISESSIMDIKEFFQKGLTEKSIFKLWMGGIKARFERLKTKDSEAKFYTPTAVMGLRGTTIWLIVDWEGRTRAGFEEGHGYIYSDKEGEKAVNENEEAEVSLEGDITIKSLKMKTVPDVVGKSLSDAKGEIIGALLKVGEIRAEESTQPPDTVLSQYPRGKEEVLANTSVSLVVASSIPPCVVPNLIGLSKENAEVEIIKAGLKLGSVVEIASDEPEGNVLRQRPNPGTEVKEGSLVDIAISKKVPPEKPQIPPEKGSPSEKPPIPPEKGSPSEKPPIPPEKPPIPIIHHQWTIPDLFVNEIPYLVLNVTPSDPKWAPLFIKIEGRLVKLNNLPYILNFNLSTMKIGVNEINVSCWFENGPSASSVIPSPYYDPIPPKIIGVRAMKIDEAIPKTKATIEKNIVRISVTVEDRESGIKYVRIGGKDAGSPRDYIREEKAGRDVYIKGVYEKVIPLLPDKPITFINIEVSDNAGNKRTRIEPIPDVPPSPK